MKVAGKPVTDVLRFILIAGCKALVYIIMDTEQRLSCAPASPRIVNGQHIAWCQ